MMRWVFDEMSSALGENTGEKMRIDSYIHVQFPHLF